MDGHESKQPPLSPIDVVKRFEDFHNEMTAALAEEIDDHEGLKTRNPNLKTSPSSIHKDGVLYGRLDVYIALRALAGRVRAEVEGTDTVEGAQNADRLAIEPEAE